MKIYYVQWEDSRMVTCGWQYKGEAEELVSSPCQSVGIVIKKSRYNVVLAPNWSEDIVSQVVVIPRKSITLMECIKEIK